MRRNKLRKRCSSFLESKRGIAVPVTFLLLFVSLTVVVSATYYFAVSKINTKSQGLKVSAARQGMLSLESSIQFVSWSPGANEIYRFDDFGGKLSVEPTAKRLTMNLTGPSFYDVFFNSSIGKVVYELPPSEDSNDNVFLKGDSRVVLNQSSSSMTQLRISMGTRAPEITLSYRPLVGSTVTETSQEKPTNTIRVYVINLNSSQALNQQGGSRLKMTCTNVTSTWWNYDFSYLVTSLTLKVDLDGTSGLVSLPVSSNANGALVNLETVICNIKIQSGGV